MTARLPETIRRKFEKAGQGHVFRFWDRLAAPKQKEFLKQAASVSLPELKKRFAAAMKPAAFSPQQLLPPETVQPDPDSPKDHQAIQEGEALLKAGKVACLLVAGGQGTRLGINRPKGTVELAGKSLFRRHCESLLKIRRTHKQKIPLYVMTSFATHRATAAYFRKHRYFGLPAEDVFFFQQGSVPSLDAQGRLLLAHPGAILENPDGHGGMLEAASKEGIFRNCKKRGITTLFYFQVDNPLVKIADPLFLGYHSLLGSVFSLKTIRKKEPDEKLGVVCQKEKRLSIVEYSELPDSLRHARRPDGSLLMDAGSIAIHAFDLAWLMGMAKKKDALPWHRADKKVKAIPFAAKSPEETDAVKFEKFIFDLLPKATKTLVLETDREKEFHPIKGPKDLVTFEALYASG